MPRNHFIDARIGGEFLIGRVHHVVALGPTADCDQIDIDHGAYEIATGADRHGLADVWIEFEFVLDVFRRKHGAVVEMAYVFGAIDDPQLTGLAIEKPGIAGVNPAVGREHFRGLFGIFVVSGEHARRAKHDFAAVRYLDFDVGRGLAHTLGVNFAV